MLTKHGFLIFVGLVSLMLSACSGAPETGPKEVKWDRDICERCRMVLSDRHYSAQIRYFPAEKKRSRVALFDDIGCAYLWLEDKSWKDDPRTEIRVNDYRSGRWIDAHSATYLRGKITPMQYGLGATPEPAEDGLTFEQAKRYIEEVEERSKIHGVHLLERFEVQSAKREAERKNLQARD